MLEIRPIQPNEWQAAKRAIYRVAHEIFNDPRSLEESIAYHESLGEMKHAEKLIDRIIFLEGVPEIARYDVIRVGTNVPEQFEFDLQLEMKGVKAYNDGIQLCIKVNDGGSRDLMEKILVESEEHVDWLETQIGLIGEVGLANYLQSQMGEAAS